MKRTTLMIMVLLLPLLMLLTRAGRAADVDVILRDISGGLGVGKAELDGQRFEVKVARLAPMTEFTVEVRGSFSQGSAVLGRFLSGAKGGAKFSIQVTDIDLSLVKEVEVHRSDGGSGAAVLRGLAQ